MNEKQSLLDKYSIPIEHLDFEYIRTCQNARELEKMIEILKSGEEGFYPDLTKFAEEKLREIDPDNRMLRTEVRCLSTGTKERQEINVCEELIAYRNIFFLSYSKKLFNSARYILIGVHQKYQG